MLQTLVQYVNLFRRVHFNRKWTDRVFGRGWRLQQHERTDMARIVSPNGDVVYGGFLKDVEKEINRRMESFKNASCKEVVILIPGFLLPRVFFLPLMRYLNKRGYLAVMPLLGSKDTGIEERAENLVYFLNHMELCHSFDVIAMESGADVARAALNLGGKWRKNMELKSVLFIAPPTNGFSFAYNYRHGRIANALWGRLFKDAATLEGRPEITYPYAVLAGGRNEPVGYNKSLSGDNDGIVRVAESRDKNLSDFILKPYRHVTLPLHHAVHETILRYLRTGRFRRNRAEVGIQRTDVLY